MAEQKEEKQRLPALVILRRSFGYLKPYWGLMALTLLLALVLLTLELAGPQITGGAISYLERLTRQGRLAEAVLWPFALAFLVLVLLQSGVRFLRTLTQTQYDHRVENDIRIQLYERVQVLSFRYHTNTPTGQLISRMTRDTTRLAHLHAHLISGIVQTSLFIAGAMVAIFVAERRLGLIALGTFAVSVVATVLFARRLGSLWRGVSDSYGEVTTVLQENVAGVRVVRAFAMEDHEISKFGRQADSYVDRYLGAVAYWANRMPVVNLALGVGSAALLFMGGWLVIQRAPGMDVGVVAKCFFYFVGVVNRMRAVGRTANRLQECVGSGDRVLQVMDEANDVPDTGSQPLPPGPGAVRFNSVVFKHVEGQEVLSGVSLEVAGGECVAVVGRTGSGKTSLVELIARFHDVDAGSVQIDGCDVRQIPMKELRRAVGVVFQETFLFSATVAENIAYGRPDAPREQIEAAARIARAHEFIAGLEKGYDTIVGERGVTLSGGQKQRIAIARALLMNPRILIMDDATSSVDSETERLIHEAMQEASRGRTTFIIAHRLSTVRRADRIVVLQDGRVAELGTHEELSRRGGLYQRICEEQFGGPPAD